jgi:BirA family biotin operon repressor/biotin-[acetyl-CoA-carboxylase] ligase
MGSTVVECRPADPPAQMLAFVTGLAVRGTLADWNALEGELRLKWPNDVLLNGAKLAGILLEREGDHVVVGIGVNLARAPRIEGRETIALADLGMQVPRDDFAHRLAERFAQELDRWRTFGTAHLLSQWSKAALAVGTPITVHEPGGAVLRGTVSGLGEDGSLLLDLGNGESRAIHAGDVMLARQ